MDELLVMVIGGIGALVAPALTEAFGEALRELVGAIFGAVAAIGESRTDVGTVAPLGAIAGEAGGTGEVSNGGSGRIGRFLAVNATINHASNRSSIDSSEPAHATLSNRDK